MPSKCWSHSKYFRVSYISTNNTAHAKISPSSSHLVKKMLLADSTDLANVVDKSDVSFCCSVAFTDTDVSEPLQEISPGVRPDPVPHRQSHFMVSVSVTLQGGEQQRCSLPSTGGVKIPAFQISNLQKKCVQFPVDRC